MARQAEVQSTDQPSTKKSDVLRPLNGAALNEQPPQEVALGVGSRSPFVETTTKSMTLPRLRGMLPVPPEVEAEITAQEAKHLMTPEYRKTLRDRLTLEYYFSNIEIAFRRSPDGIEVLAAGLNEIAEFRQSSTREQRQGVVYGVG